MDTHERVRRLLAPDIEVAMAQVAADRGCTQDQLSVGLQRVLEQLAFSAWQRCEANRRYIAGVWETPEDADTPVVQPDELDELRQRLVPKR